MFSGNRFVSSAAALLIAAVGGGVGAAALANGSGGTPPTTVPDTGSGAVPSGRPPVAQVDSRLRDHFSVFRGQASPPAGTGGAAISDGATRRYGLNPALARRVSRGAGVIVIVPGADYVCLFDGATQSGTCNTIEAALAGQVTAATTCSSSLRSGTTRVVGMLPDGATDLTEEMTDGSTQSLSIVNNTYTGDSANGVQPIGLSWKDGGGHLQTLDVPLPVGGGC